MFRTSQMITATQLFKHFALVAEEAYERPEPVLVTQRNGQHLVVLSADLFESLAAQVGEVTKKFEAIAGIREKIYCKELGS